MEMQEEENTLISASSSLTIAQFEKNKPTQNRRVSFNDLQLHDNASQLIDNNPVLKLLHSKELLFFSTEYRENVEFIYKESINSSSKPKKTPSKKVLQLSDTNESYSQIPQLSDTNKIDDIILRSLNNFNNAYNDCNSLAQAFLITSTELAMNGLQINEPQDKSENNEEITSFHGLSIEAIPYFDGKTRSDYYQYDRQQISICFQDLPVPLPTDNNINIYML